MKQLLCLGLAILACSNPAMAASVTIGPDELRVKLLEGNTEVLTALNQVVQAKDKLNSDRAALLPGANLNVLLGSSGSSFVVSAISVLVPFLLPSNWFNLDAGTHLLNAQADSYYVTALNAYASAYALYETIVADTEARATAESQFEALNQLKGQLQQQSALFDNVSPQDLANAVNQANLAELKVLQLDELLGKEKANLKQALNIDINTDIQIALNHVDPAPLELETNLKVILDKAITLAPEANQLNELIAASGDESWSEVFSFLNAAALAPSSSNSGVSLSKLNFGAQLNLGFGTFPQLQLTNDSKAATVLLQQSLTEQLQNVVESSVSAITQARHQLDVANDTQKGLSDLYQSEVQSYNLGLTDLLHVLSASESLASAGNTQIAAQRDLDSLRINLHRILLSGAFAAVKPCQIRKVQNSTGGGLFSWLTDIFAGDKNHVSIDQACNPNYAAKEKK